MYTNFFLNYSGRRIFTFILVIPIIIQFILLHFVQMISREELYYLLFLFFGFLYLPYFYWLNTVVTYLYSYPNKYFKLKLKDFKVSLVIAIIVVFNFVFLIAYMFSIAFKEGEPNNILILCMGLIQFVGFVSCVYLGYFVIKLTLTLELKREINFLNVINNLAFFYFPLIGFWIIHNKLKSIQLSHKTANNLQ